MTDTEIISLIGKSPSDGHRALFDEFYSYVYAISVNVLRGYGSREDVEECVIDSFAAVINGLDSTKAVSLKAFIGTVAKNKAISMRRAFSSKYGKNVSIDSDELGELASDERVDRNAEDSAISELILHRIKELGEPDSAIIIQKFFYERSADEIGRIVGMKPAAVRMRCSRAVKKLRSLLADLN